MLVQLAFMRKLFVVSVPVQAQAAPVVAAAKCATPAN